MINRKMNIDAVLYSGGLDSFITYHYVEKEIQSKNIVPVYVPLGHRYQKSEIDAISKTLPSTGHILGFQRLGTHEEKDAFIWNRNAFLCLAASRVFHAIGEDPVGGTIWLTVQQDEMSIPDRSPEFLQSMGDTLKTLGYPVDVMSPFMDMDKADMVRWYLDVGLPAKDLLKTSSCYSPGLYHCGNCPACVRRWIAFTLNGICEEYEQYPWESKVGKAYLQRAKDGEYSSKRCSRTIEAFGRAMELGDHLRQEK